MADDSLTQDYDAHIPFTFAAIPEQPMFANRAARARRWATIAFAESWLAVFFFRLKTRLRRANTPLLPSCCDMLSRALFRVQIGNQVTIGPGLMMTHGNVVIDGRTRIGARCQINPWVTIGLSNSKKLGFSVEGPTIGDDVHVGTGAKVLGPVRIGDGARIGANAVVVHDVPAGATVVGAPARVIGGGVSAPSQPPSDGRDARLASEIRGAIAAWRTQEQTLQALVDTINVSLEMASDDFRSHAQASLKDDLIFLDAVAATGGEETRQVAAAVEAVDEVVGRMSQGGR